jgi:hypothetical protein
MVVGEKSDGDMVSVAAESSAPAGSFADLDAEPPIANRLEP